MTTLFTAFDRQASLRRLVDEEFDVLVVGGGITGAGVALDAASRGLRTALVERLDFASGTSSKSSKLVHGGIRYLQQREIGLVHESLTERHRLLRNAPHLVSPLSFLVPLFGKGGVVDKGLVRGYAMVLYMYDIAGGWKIGKMHKRVDAAEVSSRLPTLRTDRLVSGFLYYDARTDDARLTLAVLRTAVLDHGAVVVNYARVSGFELGATGRVESVLVDVTEPRSPVDAPVPEKVRVRARCVVNATGVWGDEISLLADDHHAPQLRPAKGIHITVPQAKLPCDIAAVVPVRGDSRSIFVVPWGDHVYLGTTDTDYSGSLDDPRLEAADVTYILDAINAAVSTPISASDITGTWAGLRPLATGAGNKRPPSARTADLSRRHAVSVSPSGMVTITGGKLTTYRRMAEDTVDVVVRELGSRARRSVTTKMALRGSLDLARARADLAARGTRAGLDADILEQLASRYGAEAGAVVALCDDRPELARRLDGGLPMIAAEVVYAARYEMAVCVDDFLDRRTRALLHDAQAALEAAGQVAELLERELAWPDGRAGAEVAHFADLVERDLAAPRAVAQAVPAVAHAPSGAARKEDS
jgi:glycerol-3-phosphate dehydrogenase